MNKNYADLIGATIEEIKCADKHIHIVTSKGTITAGEGDGGTMRNPEPYFYYKLFSDTEGLMERYEAGLKINSLKQDEISLFQKKRESKIKQLQNKLKKQREA